MNTAYLSVGSNLGDKEKNLRLAFDALASRGIATVEKISGFYRTAPVGYTDQDWFVNAAVKVKTALTPRELLKKIKEIESAAGRDLNGVRFGPRVIDLDILLYNDTVLDSEELTVPHPRMHKRSFVLTPLCDIDAGIIHPVAKKRVDQLLSEIDDQDQKVEPVSGE